MTGETPPVQEALPVYATEALEAERVPPGYKQTEVGVIPEDWDENLASLVLQCHFDLDCGQVGSSPESLNYPRPEPFFAPFAVSTVGRAIGPKLLLW